MALDSIFEQYRDKDYLTTLRDDAENLLDPSNKYYLLYRNILSFSMQNNHVSILLQNFLQYNIKLPVFLNSVILENTSNDSNESFKVLLSRIPFLYIIAEHDNYYDFILEQSIDLYEELIYNKVCGFYLNVLTNKNEALTFYDYLVPFIIENDEVKILPKNEILKYIIFYISEKCSREIKFRMIFLTKNSIPSDTLLESMVSALNLPESADCLKDHFENNYILIKNQNREQMVTSYLTTINRGNTTIVKLIYDLYFTIPVEKQYLYHVNIIRKNIKMLKSLVVETIIEFNEQKESFKYKLYNDIIYMECIKTLKLYNDEYNYYKIKNKYKYLFDFICKCNNISFGADLLMIKKTSVLNETECIRQINEYKEIVLDKINKFFNIDFKDMFIKKNNLLTT